MRAQAHALDMSAPQDTALSAQFMFLQEACITAAALRAAQQLGVLDRLARSPADLATLARDCGMGQRGATLLMTALSCLGVVEVGADDEYRLAPLSLISTRIHWDDLAVAIRDDRPLIAGDTAMGAETLYPPVVSLLGALFAAAAERAADHLARPGLRVLDAGAGAAPWSLALTTRDPGIHVTAVDFPAVLSSTRTAVRSAGLEAQFTYLAGDIFTVECGAAVYDLAIAANICHLFDADANRRLLQRLFDALRPGGTLAIIDILSNEQLDGPRSVMLYALGLFARANHGQVYPFSTYAGWLADGGYSSVQCHGISAAPAMSLITAYRP